MKIKKRTRAFLTGFILFSMLVNILGGGGYSLNVKADNPAKTWAFQNNGELVEQDNIKLKETAVEDTYGQDPFGEFDVKLEVKGDVPIVKSEEKLDVVLAIDRSNSMSKNKRMKKAKAAATAFIDKLLTDGEGKVRTDDKVKVGLVGFGGANEEKTGPVLESYALSDNPSDLKNAVNGYEVYPNGQKSGATFTQAGLMEAYKILKDDNGHNKAIVLISDGEPTYAYNDKYNQVIGNGYDWYLKTIRETTIAEAGKIKENKVTIYSLGIGVNETGKKVLQQIATSTDYYSDVDDVADNLNEELNKVADKIRPNIVNADIELTMNDMVDFKNATDLTKIKVEIKDPEGADQAALTAKADAIKKTVTWNGITKTLSFGDITLDKDEVLNITYQAGLAEAHRDGKWKALNAAAVLYPEGKAKNTNNTNNKLNFKIPEVKDKNIVFNDKTYTKKWVGTPVSGLKVGLFKKADLITAAPTAVQVEDVGTTEDKAVANAEEAVQPAQVEAVVPGDVAGANTEGADQTVNTETVVPGDVAGANAEGADQAVKPVAVKDIPGENNEENITFNDVEAKDDSGNDIEYVVRELDAAGNILADGQEVEIDGNKYTVYYNDEERTITNTMKKAPDVPSDPPADPEPQPNPEPQPSPDTPTEPSNPFIPPLDPSTDVPYTPTDVITEEDTPLANSKVDDDEEDIILDDDDTPRETAKISDDNPLESVDVFDDDTPKADIPKTGEVGNMMMLFKLLLLGLGLTLKKEFK